MSLFRRVSKWKQHCQDRTRNVVAFVYGQKMEIQFSICYTTVSIQSCKTKRLCRPAKIKIK